MRNWDQLNKPAVLVIRFLLNFLVPLTGYCPNKVLMALENLVV
jgi:hypothetical protein